MHAPIALTTGEPAGIGPEVALKAVQNFHEPIMLIGSEILLKETARKLNIGWPLPAHVSIHNIDLAEDVTPGKLNVKNAEYVLNTLAVATDGAMSGAFNAVATAPVQKSIISEAGHTFTGHTEFFRDRSGVQSVVMMLVASDAPNALRVALATTHLPIAKLSQSITGELLDDVMRILDHDLRASFGIKLPKIAVTGLNPHAGESGHMGREEIDVIAPAIERMRKTGIDVTGPWPADTIFVPSHSSGYDAVLCMYHDQGLPVLKREGFGHGVNITLGLPWIRTSVDHGTALDIAGTGVADAGSMLVALRLAHTLAHNRQLFNKQQQTD